MERVNIVFNWHLPGVITEDTYITAYHTGGSRIDHINCSFNMIESISDVSIYKRVSNMSGHRPLSMCIKTNSLPYEEVYLSSAPLQEKVSWNKATERHLSAYKTSLDNILKAVEMPPVVFCQDLKCTDPAYKDQIQILSDTLDDLCLASGHKCVPKCRRKKQNKPGCVDEVKPFLSRTWQNSGMTCGVLTVSLKMEKCLML